MLPLVAADLTWGTERFNLCMGVLGLAVAGGATLSTLIAGLIADQLGEAAFLALAGCGAMAVIGVLTAPAPDRTVLTIIRMGRGLMMGVDQNRDMEWVGASAALWVGE